MSYIYILVPLTAVIIAQLSKFLVPKNKLKFNLKNLVAYSGMPSSHAAVTISLATIIALREGFGSADFAVAALLAFISIRDAVGIRQYIGKQGKIINDIVGDLEDEKYLDENFPQMIEKVGHTPKQLLVGALIGLAVALIFYYC